MSRPLTADDWELVRIAVQENADIVTHGYKCCEQSSDATVYTVRNLVGATMFSCTACGKSWIVKWGTNE